MTKREAINAALLAVFAAQAPGLGMQRNVALGEPDGLFSRLADGKCELVEEFINGPVYEYTTTPTVLIVVEKASGDLDNALDAAIELVASAIATVTDLGGLITAIRPQPPNYEPKEIWGAADLKAAEIPIEIDFWTDRSIG